MMERSGVGTLACNATLAYTQVGHRPAGYSGRGCHIAQSLASPNNAYMTAPQGWQRQQRRRDRRQLAPPMARKQAKGVSGGKGFAKDARGFTPKPVEPAAEQSSEAAGAQEPIGGSGRQLGSAPATQPPAAPTFSASPVGALPAVDRGRVLAVCAQVSVLVAALGLGLRQLAPAISPAVKDGRVESVEALLNCESCVCTHSRGRLSATQHVGSI